MNESKNQDTDKIIALINKMHEENLKVVNDALGKIQKARESLDHAVKQSGLSEENWEEEAKKFSREDLPEKLKPIFDMIEKEAVAELAASGHERVDTKKTGSSKVGIKMAKKGLRI